MLPLKNLLCTTLLCLLVLPAAAQELDEIDIRANFTNFWSAMSKQDYRGASAFVHPLDLSALRTQVLPIFLKLGAAPNEGLQAAAEIFFQDTPKERRPQLSGPDLYVLLFKMLETAEPDAVEMFDALRAEILEIKMEGGNKASVRFKFRFDIPVETEEDKAAKEEAEREEDVLFVGKLNGRWFMRMSESPSGTAEEFKKQFGL